MSRHLGLQYHSYSCAETNTQYSFPNGINRTDSDHCDTDNDFSPVYNGKNHTGNVNDSNDNDIDDDSPPQYNKFDSSPKKALHQNSVRGVVYIDGLGDIIDVQAPISKFQVPYTSLIIPTFLPSSASFFPSFFPSFHPSYFP